MVAALFACGWSTRCSKPLQYHGTAGEKCSQTQCYCRTERLLLTGRSGDFWAYALLVDFLLLGVNLTFVPVIYLKLLRFNSTTTTKNVVVEGENLNQMLGINKSCIVKMFRQSYRDPQGLWWSQFQLFGGDRAAFVSRASVHPPHLGALWDSTGRWEVLAPTDLKETQKRKKQQPPVVLKQPPGKPSHHIARWIIKSV